MSSARTLGRLSFSSTVARCATISVNRGGVAFRIAVRGAKLGHGDHRE